MLEEYCYFCYFNVNMYNVVLYVCYYSAIIFIPFRECISDLNLKNIVKKKFHIKAYFIDLILYIFLIIIKIIF